VWDTGRPLPLPPPPPPSPIARIKNTIRRRRRRWRNPALFWGLGGLSVKEEGRKEGRRLNMGMSESGGPYFIFFPPITHPGGA